jgi:L-amino acid N-acyltransferase YncA
MSYDGYTVALEHAFKNYAELEPLYRQHYATMRERIEATGVPMSAYNPRIEEYRKAADGGWLLNFVLRCGGKAVGYANIYLTNDMHNNDFIAQEDTIYVDKQHRNGSGRLLARFVHQDLKARGVKRLNVTTATDLIVSKWLARQGYKHTAHCMTLVF